MPQELLGNYAVEKNPNLDYKLMFEIPNNCNYTTSIDNLVNLITISLNEGERDPSLDYVKYDLDYNATNDILTIQFEQQDLTAIENLVYVKKPRLVINDISNLSI